MWYVALSLSGHFPAAQYNDRCEICLRARYSSEVMVQYKVVRVLTELCKLVMRPPNQLRAVTNKS